MSKPNTMDDWIDELLEAYYEMITDKVTPLDQATDVTKDAITAKLQEVDRAAREWELNWITGLNPKHPDFTKIVKDRLASLKGGDV